MDRDVGTVQSEREYRDLFERSMRNLLGPVSGRTIEGRPVVSDSFGTPHTEVTTTLAHPQLNYGMPTNIPTIYGGRAVSDEDALAIMLANGGIDPDTKKRRLGYLTFDDAIKAAQQRSGSLDHAMMSLGQARMMNSVNQFPPIDRPLMMQPLRMGIIPYNGGR